MIASDLVRLVVPGRSRRLLLLTGSAEVWQLAALAAVYGTADAFFRPRSPGWCR